MIKTSRNPPPPNTSSACFSDLRRWLPRRAVSVILNIYKSLSFVERVTAALRTFKRMVQSHVYGYKLYYGILHLSDEKATVFRYSERFLAWNVNSEVRYSWGTEVRMRLRSQTAQTQNEKSETRQTRCFIYSSMALAKNKNKTVEIPKIIYLPVVLESHSTQSFHKTPTSEKLGPKCIILEPQHWHLASFTRQVKSLGWPPCLNKSLNHLHHVWFQSCDPKWAS